MADRDRAAPRTEEGRLLLAEFNDPDGMIHDRILAIEREAAAAPALDRSAAPPSLRDCVIEQGRTYDLAALGAAGITLIEGCAISFDEAGGLVISGDRMALHKALSLAGEQFRSAGMWFASSDGVTISDNKVVAASPQDPEPGTERRP